MKRFVEIAWNCPCDKKLFDHLRNDMRFKSDHLAVFDSVTQCTGNLDFHADNSGLDRKKFSRVYNQVAESVLNEIIRLAGVGYAAEQKAKEKSQKS